MKMTKIRLIGLSTIDLPVKDATPSDRYILKNAEGLGPPEVDVSISETLYAGGVYQGRRPQGREVVLEIGLNPDYTSGQTASDLRSATYGLLTPGVEDSVKIDIMDGEVLQAFATGYVRNLEPSPFSKDPMVQITIACLHPYFQSPTALFVSPGNTATPRIENKGTAPTGFYMRVLFTEPLTTWSLINARGEYMKFDYNFLSGDELVFDTRHGSRSITLKRGLGAEFNLMHSLSSDSIWHQLYGGVNNFTTSSTAYEWGDVYYFPQYWGI